MHKLKNGSQVAERPARKETAGTAGYFSESNDAGSPSYPGQDFFNDQIDEYLAFISAGDLTPDSEDLTQMSQSVSNQIRSRNLLDVSGTADAIVLSSKTNKPAVKTLLDYDEFQFIVSATNTSTVTLKIDELNVIPISNISAANQLFETALATVMYRGDAFYLIDQINPKTGNSVLDIAKLYTDTVDIVRPGEYSLDGAALSRAAHPIAFAIASASSNYIDQATKDADPIAYGGFYGDGDGSSTFTLPIVGGEFIRMFDDGRGVDDGRVFGSFQEDAFQGHWHATAEGGDTLAGNGYLANSPSYSSMDNNARDAVTDGQNGVPRMANETRSRSIAYYGKTRL
ncbi:prophage MuSo2, tail fiber protein, putative [Marinomonas sp. MED121]|uniref:hypothetical protein n=1 Tax=Marinomonas sp. MED121 TaxID=314277 RepID=UPI0000690B03|nr:hypothetical protein [Marinomonas sp. MED121]EAQ65993.1 prophage MuSo2, tail fiber protein, putative [Marinomonas sp. MED121]